jgi:phosphate transport system substrate-binding protein
LPRDTNVTQLRCFRVDLRGHSTGGCDDAPDPARCPDSSRSARGRLQRRRQGSRPRRRRTAGEQRFPNPIYQKWFDTYGKSSGIRINYQSIGSGGGIRQFTEGTVDFGASDAPMTDEQIAAVKGDVLHVPTVIGAVVLTYNLPALGTTPLKLDGGAISDIFLGKITKWNDAQLAALNPGVALPNADIIVVHRSDGSGTSFVFTDYLTKVSPEWAQQVGKAPSVNWPIGLGGKGNEGVTQQVKQSEGSIGYVELIYALSNRLAFADVKNAGGQFVTADLKSVTAAAGSAEFPPDTDYRVSITNAPGADAYPIASFTWLLVKPGLADPVKAKHVNDFLKWMLAPEAQRIAADMDYAPLPVSLIQMLQKRIGA